MVDKAIDQVTGELRDVVEGEFTKVVNGAHYILTQDEVNQKSLDALLYEQVLQDNAYLINRINAYPPLGEQLDMIYWDKINNTTVWEDTITDIKTTYPKPNQ